MSESPPPPHGQMWNQWGERLNDYLRRVKDKLTFKNADSRATQDGVMLWDATNKYPVVSKDGVWTQIVLEDGRDFLYTNTDQSCAANNTATPISFSLSGTGQGITLDGSKIYLTEGGNYLATFTAQILSTNASALTFYFWPRINGTDVPLGATRVTIAANGQTMPVTKSAILTVEAGDYLEAMWATDGYTTATLEAYAATAFSPASPSVSLSLMRISA